MPSGAAAGFGRRTPQTRRVRVATFNILHARSPSDGRVDLDRFTAAIRTLDADILALQEVDRDQPRSQGADLTLVAAAAMGATAHRFAAAMVGTADGTWQAATGQDQPGAASYGIALLSRLPVGEWQVVRLAALPAPVPMRGGDQRRLRLVQDEARVAVAATVQAPGANLLVVTTHLSFVPGWNTVQLRRLWRALPAHSGPLIMMGDLNMGPLWATRVTGLQPMVSQPTFPAHAPQRQLDHILVRGLSPDEPGRAVWFPLSDHLALTVGLSCPASVG